jgi:hypothetical protein
MSNWKQQLDPDWVQISSLKRALKTVIKELKQKYVDAPDPKKISMPVEIRITCYGNGLLSYSIYEQQTPDTESCVCSPTRESAGESTVYTGISPS